MLAGVATRRHHDVAEPVGHEIESRSKGMSKSAISRRFVAAIKQALAELMGRNLASFVTSKPAFPKVPGGLCTEGFDMIGTCENCGAPIRHLGCRRPPSSGNHGFLVGLGYPPLWRASHMARPPCPSEGPRRATSAIRLDSPSRSLAVRTSRQTATA
jgi:hypothetical protein